MDSLITAGPAGIFWPDPGTIEVGYPTLTFAVIRAAGIQSPNPFTRPRFPVARPCGEKLAGGVRVGGGGAGEGGGQSVMQGRG